MVLFCAPADAGLVPFSVDIAPACCDLLLPELPSLVWPANPVLGSCLSTETMSFAVVPLDPVAEEAFCCDWGTVLFCSRVEVEDMAVQVRSVSMDTGSSVFSGATMRACVRAYSRLSRPHDNRDVAYPLW